MLRQYNAPHQQGGHNPLGVGVIPTGAIFYLQDDHVLRRGDKPICRAPWQVVGWLPRRIEATRRSEDGKWRPSFNSRPMTTAIVKSLRDGRTAYVSAHMLEVHEDIGLRADPSDYPDKPNLDLWRR